MYSVEPLLQEFASFSFEDVCKEFVREMQKQNELPFRYSEYLDTLAKLTPLKKKAKFYYALFSESGFEDKLKNDVGENDVRLYTLEDIVHYKGN